MVGLVRGEANLAYLFEKYVLDLDRRELRHEGALIKLEPLAFDLLVYLVTRHERVVSRDELIDAVWQSRIVSDAALTTRLNAVRHAIADSGKAQRLIRTLPRVGIRFIGEVQEQPPGDEAAVPPFPAVERGAVSRIPITIALLPFVAITRDAEECWVANSLVDGIATALANFRLFSVIVPQPHSDADTGLNELKQIRRELGAGYAVRGTVHRRGDRVRVSAHLVETLSGSLLWADRFDGLLADGFSLQEELATTITARIEPPLRMAEASRPIKPADRAITPQHLYLRAHPIFSDGQESVARSFDLLQRALALDPNFAPALADAAFCLQVLDINCGGADHLARRRQAIGFARKALRVSCDPEAVATAAFALSYFGEEIDEARALINHSLVTNPSFSRGWYMSGMAHLYAGEPEAAMEAFETAIRLNPHERLARRNLAGIGMSHLFTGNFDEAVPSLRAMVREFPRWATPYAALASCYAHLGSEHDAATVVRRLRTVDASLVPNTVQFRSPKHRELLSPGIKLSGKMPAG